MWRNRGSENYLYSVKCPKGHRLYKNSSLKCPEISYPLSNEKCKLCSNVKELLKCGETTCGSIIRICLNCHGKSLTSRKLSKSETTAAFKISDYKKFILLVPLIGISLWFYFRQYGRISGNDHLTFINELKMKYPSQRNETWHHFLGVLDKEILSVKSISFLYREDKETTNSLINELVLFYNGNKPLNSEEFTFSDFEADDYGFLLEHYREVVQKFRIFITDLNKVSGNVARIFHSLCDEISSDIKPSLFIFTLKYDKRTEIMKPLERATHLLKEAWHDLPENELFPLLSRMVKNVVDIVPKLK